MVAFSFVFAASFATFYRDQEDLRTSGHGERGGRRARHCRAGTYGYPEQFIPQGEFPGAATSPTAAASAATAVAPEPSKA